MKFSKTVPLIIMQNITNKDRIVALTIRQHDAFMFMKFQEILKQGQLDIHLVSHVKGC